MPANILNLPAYKVLRVEETEHDYHIRAEIAQRPSHCTNCGSDRLLRYGRNEQLVRDLSIHGKRVGIHVDIRRRPAIFRASSGPIRARGQSP